MVLRTFLYMYPHGLGLTFVGYALTSGNTEPEDMDVSNRVYNGKWFSKVDVSVYTLYSGVYKFLLFPSPLSLLCFPKGLQIGSLRYLDPISGETESRVLVGSSWAKPLHSWWLLLCTQGSELCNSASCPASGSSWELRVRGSCLERLAHSGREWGRGKQN